MRELLEILKEQRGIVIGENHAARAPLKFLIDNAENFKELGIEYLFIERFGSDFKRNYEPYFSDEVRDDDFEKHFNEKWEKPFSRQLIAANMNMIEKRKPLIDDEISSTYTLKNLLITMKKYGIMIIGINLPSSLTYGLDVYNESKARKILAQKMNKHMGEVIQKFIDISKGKFLVLTGAAHAYKYVAPDGEEVKGLSTILNCKSVYICEDGFDEILLNDNIVKQLSKNRLIRGVTFRIFEEQRDIKSTIEHMEIEYMLSIRVIPDTVRLNKQLQYVLVSKFRESSIRSNNGFRWLFSLEHKEITGVDEFNIGFIHYEKKQYTFALDFFKKSVRKNYPDGMYMVGMMLYEAKGCQQNIGLAIRCLNYAAEKNHPDATYNLSRIFRFNIKDNHQADIYLKKAFLLGYCKAINEWKDLSASKKENTHRKLSFLSTT